MQLFVALTIVLQSAKSFTKYPGCGCTDRNEIAPSSYVISQSQCQSQCSANEACISFEWWGYHEIYKTNYCHLSNSCNFNTDAHSTAVEIVENYNDINLYIKNDDFILYEDYGCAGQNDATFTATSLSSCRSKCINNEGLDSECLSFEWYPYHPSWDPNMCILSKTCTANQKAPYSGDTYKLYLYVKNTNSPTTSPTTPEPTSSKPTLYPTPQPTDPQAIEDLIASTGLFDSLEFVDDEIISTPVAENIVNTVCDNEDKLPLWAGLLTINENIADDIGSLIFEDAAKSIIKQIECTELVYMFLQNSTPQLRMARSVLEIVNIILDVLKLIPGVADKMESIMEDINIGIKAVVDFIYENAMIATNAIVVETFGEESRIPDDFIDWDVPENGERLFNPFNDISSMYGMLASTVCNLITGGNIDIFLQQLTQSEIVTNVIDQFEEAISDLLTSDILSQSAITKLTTNNLYKNLAFAPSIGVQICWNSKISTCMTRSHGFVINLDGVVNPTETRSVYLDLPKDDILSSYKLEIFIHFDLLNDVNDATASLLEQEQLLNIGIRRDSTFPPGKVGMSKDIIQKILNQIPSISGGIDMTSNAIKDGNAISVINPFWNEIYEGTNGFRISLLTSYKTESPYFTCNAFRLSISPPSYNIVQGKNYGIFLGIDYRGNGPKTIELGMDWMFSIGRRQLLTANRLDFEGILEVVFEVIFGEFFPSQFINEIGAFFEDFMSSAQAEVISSVETIGNDIIVFIADGIFGSFLDAINDVGITIEQTADDIDIAISSIASFSFSVFGVDVNIDFSVFKTLIIDPLKCIFDILADVFTIEDAIRDFSGISISNFDTFMLTKFSEIGEELTVNIDTSCIVNTYKSLLDDVVSKAEDKVLDPVVSAITGFISGCKNGIDNIQTHFKNTLQLRDYNIVIGDFRVTIPLSSFSTTVNTLLDPLFVAFKSPFEIAVDTNKPFDPFSFNSFSVDLTSVFGDVVSTVKSDVIGLIDTHILKPVSDFIIDINSDIIWVNGVITSAKTGVDNEKINCESTFDEACVDECVWFFGSDVCVNVCLEDIFGEGFSDICGTIFTPIIGLMDPLSTIPTIPYDLSSVEALANSFSAHSFSEKNDNGIQKEPVVEKIKPKKYSKNHDKMNSKLYYFALNILVIGFIFGTCFGIILSLIIYLVFRKVTNRSHRGYTMAKTTETDVETDNEQNKLINQK
eukprot:126599_1